jgi:hypothetical protein
MMRKLDITKESVENMLRQGITQPKIAQQIGCSVSVIERRIKQWGLKGTTAVRYDLMTLDNPVFCYLMGWFLTDGYLTRGNRVSIRVKDEGPMRTLATYFGTKHYEVGDLRELYFAWAPTIFRDSYERRKTFDAKLPGVSTRECQLMLLRGIIEGDGSIRPPKQYKSTLIRIFSASRKLAEDIQRLIQQLGYNVRLRVDRMGWEVTTSSLEFLRELYTGYKQFVLPRKQQRAEGWLSI